MVDNAPPARNLANDDTLTGAFKEVLRNFLKDTDDTLPAQIVSYDRATNLAVVKPLIALVDTNGVQHPRDPIANVPVFLFGGGGFFQSFNLPAGSLGWIKATDRDISLFLQAFAESAPNTRAFHDFNNAMFFPDVMTGYTIDAEDSEAMVIQNLTGTVKVSLNDTRVKVTSGASTLTIESAQTTLDSAQVTIEGNLQVNGTVGATGDVSSDADVLAGSISLSNHTHSGVQPGSGDTGGPQ